MFNVFRLLLVLTFYFIVLLHPFALLNPLILIMYSVPRVRNKHIIIIINTELVKVSEWLIVNKLPLNVKKTKAMVFHMAQKIAHD